MVELSVVTVERVNRLAARVRRLAAAVTGSDIADLNITADASPTSLSRQTMTSAHTQSMLSFREWSVIFASQTGVSCLRYLPPCGLTVVFLCYAENVRAFGCMTDLPRTAGEHGEPDRWLESRRSRHSGKFWRHDWDLLFLLSDSAMTMASWFLRFSGKAVL